MKIITQEGSSVDEQNEYATPEPTPDDDIRAMAKDIYTGFRKFKNSMLVKIGIIAVTIKVVDVAGKIIMENQRLKANHDEQ
jgi:hypothetical protein